MAFVMGIVTLVRLARNMPRKLTDATLYSTAMFGVDPMMKPHQLPAPAISTAEYFSMMKRMGELEEKVTVLSNKPAVMPPEKEEMLNSALSRVDVLEQELSSTKKVHLFFCCVFLLIRNLELEAAVEIVQIIYIRKLHGNNRIPKNNNHNYKRKIQKT